MAKRLGLTMRVSHASGYAEPRDCLAQDWATFLATVLPGVPWMPIPNVGLAVGDFVRAWDLQGFILTGGNDLGEEPSRDATEESLLSIALAEEFPVFGVCRGLQMLQQTFGGPVEPTLRERHVGSRHPVFLAKAVGMWQEAAERREVNSFHGWGVTASKVPAPLRVFATTEDGLAEGICLDGRRVAAVQWHPERLPSPDARDRTLVCWLFGEGG